MPRIDRLRDRPTRLLIPFDIQKRKTYFFYIRESECETMTIKPLGEFEQMVLAALIRRRGDAYGVSVQDEIKIRGGRKASLGAIYATLNRLEEKGFCKSSMSAPTAERGGRPKRLFEITGSGQAALDASWKAMDKMREGLAIGWKNARG